MMRVRLENFFLLLGSTFFLLLCIEIGLRIAGFNPFEKLLNGRELIVRESQNTAIIYELTPNSKGDAWGASVSINSYGFRDREYSPSKLDSINRIVAIGDSITFGNYLPLEATYAKQLERQFQQNDMQTEVLNLGVGGYDPAQEVALLEQFIKQFDVDEVVIGYCMNDAGTVSANLDYIRRASMYDSKFYNIRVFQFIRVNLDRVDLKMSLLFNKLRDISKGDTGSKYEGDSYVRERMFWIREYTDSEVGYLDEFSWYGDPQRVGKVVASFKKLKSLSDENGFQVTVVIIPFLDFVDVHKWAYEIVHHEAKRHGFDVIEVLEQFTAIGENDIRVSPGDVIHPGELGHRIIANSLFEFYTQDHSRLAPKVVE